MCNKTAVSPPPQAYAFPTAFSPEGSNPMSMSEFHKNSFSINPLGMDSLVVSLTKLIEKRSKN